MKKNFLPFFLSVIVVLCSVIPSPAFAEFKKVNECELARTNASLTGLPPLIRCPSYDASDYVDEEGCCNCFDHCTTMLADVEPAVNEDINSSLHDDYGYDWLKNRKVVGDLYSITSPVLSPLTVESGSCGFCGTDSVYVRVGLGAQEVDLDSKDINVTLGSQAASIAGQDQILGTIYLQGLKVKTNGNSYATLCMVEGKTAIYTQVDVTIDRIDLATLSWGDANGCAEEHDSEGRNADKAGYVGLKDTSITGVTASGSVSIDVAKDNSLGIRMVNIGIANMNVGIASLDTTVVVGDKNDFSNKEYILGTIYMKDLKMNVGGYLDIYNPVNNNAATSLGFRLNLPWLTLDTLSWGDSDGFSGATAAGFVGLRNLAINNLAIAGVATIQTITVQAGDTGTDLPSGMVFVRIGFSNLDVSMDSLNTDVALGHAKNNLNQVLGSVYLGGLNMDINGTVDIHPPSLSLQGIFFDMNLTSKNLHIDALSWGDPDGVGGITHAGYRGWRNMNIAGLNVNGSVNMEVTTIDPILTPVSFPASSDERLFASYGNHLNISPSFVHIGIGTDNPRDDPALPGALDIKVDTMSWDVVLDSSRSLDSPNASVLRSFYMLGMDVRMNGWLHISAH